MSLETRAAVLSRMGSALPYADSRPLSVQTVTLDPPGPGEVLVAIKAAGNKLSEKLEEKLDKVNPQLKDALKGLFKR